MRVRGKRKYATSTITCVCAPNTSKGLSATWVGELANAVWKRQFLRLAKHCNLESLLAEKEENYVSSVLKVGLRCINVLRGKASQASL